MDIIFFKRPHSFLNRTPSGAASELQSLRRMSSSAGWNGEFARSDEEVETIQNSTLSAARTASRARRIRWTTTCFLARSVTLGDGLWLPVGAPRYARATRDALLEAQEQAY